MPPELLTTTEAAAVLHVTARQVGNYVAKGLLPCVRYGKRGLLIPAAALESFTPPPVGPPRKKRNDDPPPP